MVCLEHFCTPSYCGALGQLMWGDTSERMVMGQLLTRPHRHEADPGPIILRCSESTQAPWFIQETGLMLAVCRKGSFIPFP